MSRSLVRVRRVADEGDERGSSFSPFTVVRALGADVRDIHVLTLRPARVRGNHFHAVKHEQILVMYTDVWSLHWDSGEGTEIAHRSLKGKGAVLITVDPGAAHAIRNDGSADLWLVAWSDRQFDPAHPDVHPRPVT